MTRHLHVPYGRTQAGQKGRRPPGARLVLFVMLVIAAGVLTGHPAETLAGPQFHHAADTDSSDSGSDSTRNLVGALAVFVLSAVGLVSVRRRWRQRALLAFVGLLCVFAVETAVHSVHHLGDQDALRACAVLVAAAHVSGVCDDVPVVVAPTWLGYISPVTDPDIFSRVLWFRPDEGRAPPVVLSS